MSTKAEKAAIKAEKDAAEVKAKVEKEEAKARAKAEKEEAKAKAKAEKEAAESGESKLKESDENNFEEDEERLQPEPAGTAAPDSDEDYLRQYQYKKVNSIPTVGGAGTDPDAGSKAETMKAHLLAQPRVSIFIPRAEGEDATVRLSVNLNGYRLDLPKQQYLELPKQVAEVIMDSQKQQVKALQPYQISGDKAKEEALG
mgnify:CR=1 FL=1